MTNVIERTLETIAFALIVVAVIMCWYVMPGTQI